MQSNIQYTFNKAGHYKYKHRISGGREYFFLLIEEYKYFFVHTCVQQFQETGYQKIMSWRWPNIVPTLAEHLVFAWRYRIQYGLVSHVMVKYDIQLQ